MIRAFQSWGPWVAFFACSALTGCAGALREKPGPGLDVPRALEGDVAAGYREYASTLERWGRWSKDPLYAIRWCPREVDPAAFVPYGSAGHWVASAGDANGWGAKKGAPVWRSDDAETWGDITTHHGWWVHVDDVAPSGAWCWIPGAAETAARVVWRSADGFVGWAPEPPSVDEDDADVDDGSWTYAFVATLLDDALDLLKDDAASVARDVTKHARSDRMHPSSPRRTGPDAQQVASARTSLAGYVLAHPSVASGVAASERTASSSPPSTSTSKSESTASSSSSSHAGLAVVVKTEALPPSMVLYDQMLRDSAAGPLVGPGPGPGWGMGASYLPMAALARAQTGRGATYAAPPSHPYGTTASSSPSSSSGSSHSSSHGSSHSSSSSSSSSSSTKSHK